jgi:hypothetical protein
VIIDGTLYVKESHHRDAYKILIVTACVVYSAAAIPFFEQLGSPSIKEFGTPVALVFLAFLFLFGLISMVGIARRRDRLEAHGQLGLSGIYAAFGGMGLEVNGLKATAFSGFLFAFAFAALWTWWQRIGRPWWLRRRARRRGAA